MYICLLARPFPVLLLIHGTDVDKNYFVGTSTTTDLVDNGYAAVSIHYRAPTLVNSIAPLQDAVCSLAWIYANSQTYPFDTQNIVVFGHSLGAGIAAVMTTLDDLHPLLEGCAYTLPAADAIRGTVTYGGSYGTPEASFSDPTFVYTLKLLAGLNDEEFQSWLDMLSTIPPTQWRSAPDMPEILRQKASYLPLAWLNGNEPPFLVVQGALDELTPVAEAQVFAKTLQAAGVPTTLAILPGMYHRVNQEALHDPLFTFLADVSAAPE